jgi:hypothetical protein
MPGRRQPYAAAAGQGKHAFLLNAVTPDIARLTDLLGHAPRTYRDFAAETAKDWRS